MVRFVGIGLTLLCCYFVGSILWRDSDAWCGYIGTIDVWIALIGGAVLWVVLNVFLGCAWSRILLLLGPSIPLSEAICMTLRTQIAKYLPGNVFHMAGRAVIARKSGVTLRTAALATGLEAALLVAIALVFSIRLLWSLPYFAWGSVVLLLLGGGTVFFLWSRFSEVFRKSKLGWSDGIPVYGALALCVVMVFVIQTTMFIWLETALYPNAAVPIFDRLELVSASWAAGFLVLGSPGGLGVREYVISMLAGSESLEARFVVVAALTRISSIFGDLLSLVLALAISAKESLQGDHA